MRDSQEPLHERKPAVQIGPHVGKGNVQTQRLRLVSPARVLLAKQNHEQRPGESRPPALATIVVVVSVAPLG